jgi:peptidoglycan/LPS O-acetylase OafA/YrhL
MLIFKSKLKKDIEKMEFFIGLLMIIIIGSTFYQIFEQRRIRRTKKRPKKDQNE